MPLLLPDSRMFLDWWNDAEKVSDAIRREACVKDVMAVTNTIPLGLVVLYDAKKGMPTVPRHLGYPIYLAPLDQMMPPVSEIARHSGKGQ